MQSAEAYKNALIYILESVYQEDRGLGRWSMRIVDQDRFDKAIFDAGKLLREP